MRRFVLALAAGLLLAACGGDEPPPAPIPLATWVHDLVENRSSDDAIPDTVEDKNIVDTDDPSAFDAYLKN